MADSSDQEELAPAHAPQVGMKDSQTRDDRRRQQTFLIMLGCGLLQLPIWGMAMSYGIFQDAYAHEALGGKSGARGDRSATGVIGTTMNGVIYLSIPCLSALLESSRGIPWRRTVAVIGTLLSAAGFLGSSWSQQVPALIFLQGVVAALGAAMLYTPTTLWVNEWFQDGGRRATAYGIQFATKNVVGTACPFVFYGLIDRLGIPNTLRMWAVIVLATGLLGIAICPRKSTSFPPSTSSSSRRRRNTPLPWAFLRHRTFYIYAIANMVFSSGYGLPQTYLSSYASEEVRLNGAASTLMVAAFNAPGILSCVAFGMLSDRTRLSASANTLICALGSGIAVFALWGTKSNSIPGLLVAFSLCYGFFAGAYSSTWGGWMVDLEREASEANEPIRTGVVYGLMNGARGIGYVVGGLSGVELLKAGSVIHERRWALGTEYGSMILFTGLSSLLGGWSIVWNGCRRRR